MGSKRVFVTKIRNRDSKQGGRKSIEIPTDIRNYYTNGQIVTVTIETMKIESLP